MKSVTLVGTDVSIDIATNKWSDGTPTYSLSSADEALKDRIRFFQLTSKERSSMGTIFTPQTYIESGDKLGFDTNDTLVTSALTISAVGNAYILSPISDVLYKSVSSMVGTTTTAGSVTSDFNASFMASLEANATKIAENLCLSGVNLMTADPIEMASTNPTFKLVNALLKGTSESAAITLSTATAPTCTDPLEGALQAIVDAGGGDTNANALSTNLLDNVKKGAFVASDILKMNVDKSVETGAVYNKEAINVDGKLVVSGITLSGTNFEELYSTGAKLEKDNLAVNIDFSSIKTDANISNKSFTLYVVSDSNWSNMESKALGGDDLGALVVALPFDINYTSGEATALGVTINPNAIVEYDVRSNGGYESAYVKDFNATTLGLTASGIITATEGETLDINVTKIFTSLESSADNNL